MEHFMFIESDRLISTAMEATYDTSLVMLSVLVANMAAYTSFLMYERIQASTEKAQKVFWLIVGAVAFSGGVWAMHFIGMLAMSLPVPIHYNILITVISILPAFAASFVMLKIRVVFGLPALSLPQRSVIMGAGIGLMHYIGISAMHADAVMRYDPLLFSLSIVVAVLLSYLALWVKEWQEKQNTKQKDNNSYPIIISSLIMGGAISGMHYVGMSAMYHFPLPEGHVISLFVTDGRLWWDQDIMAAVTAVVVIGLLLVLMATAYISRRLSWISKLKASENRLNTIFDTVVDALITTDEFGYILDFNPAAERIFGFERDELVGKKINLLMPESISSQHDAYLEGYVKTRQGTVIGKDRELEGIRKDGSLFPMDLAINTADVNGKPMFIGVVRDNTERKRAEQDLLRARDEAEEANKAKSRFLATMSHEIRTPMNGVLGMLHLLGDTRLDAKQTKFIDSAVGSGEMLLTVINDILDFSKMEAEKLTLESLPVDPVSLVEETAILISGTAHSKGLEMICKTDSNLPHLMKGDPTRLRQILTNLLSNAIKFTEHGEIVLYVSLSQNNIRFGVKDTGIGMTEEQQQAVFDPFSQADSTTTRKYGGTGLGLAISRNLVEAMGGELKVTSEYGEGSEFYFDIPMEVISEERKYSRSSSLLPDQRIIVVDDNKANLDVLVHILQSWHIKHVSAVESGAEALREIDRANEAGEPYDIALLDMNMPGMSGADVARSIRSNVDMTDMTLIVLSSLDKGDPLPEVDVWLTKPVRQTELRNTLLMLIGASEGADDDNKNSIDSDDWWFGGKNILLVEDNDINQLVAREILASVGFDISIRKNGEEALQAVQEFNYDAVLMDIQMPVMDGIEACKEIRALGGQYSSLPIIAMTAHALDGDKDKSLAAGMNGHVTKPIHPKQMFRELDKWIMPIGSQFKEEHNVNDKLDCDGLTGLPGINLKAGLERMCGNWSAYKKVLQQFRDKHSDTIEILENHIKNNEISEAARIAHGLKGTGGMISAENLFQYASDLEQVCYAEDYDKALSMITRLRELLSEVVEGLKVLDENTAPYNDSESPLKEINNEVLRSLLEELDDCIDTDLGEAQNCLSSIEYELGGTKLEPSFKQLEKIINSYDMNASKEVIHEMLQQC